jgi:lipopolysaccharide biosynthesis protein
MNSVRPIAINLPQFHPIRQNNEWWGEGFTEWTNVTRAKPLFKGHYQPHLPADLGFYDLRLSESREAQAQMAKHYGIHGFCYYHYWFNGQRLLERPLQEILYMGKPDYPFMLCWANENWTRKWDGMDDDILMCQNYSEEDDIAHMTYLMRYFKDPRYITVDGKPVFILYKSFLLPDPSATARRWRKVAAEHGMELYLCHMVFGYRNEPVRLIDGFDAAIDFEPFGVRRTREQRYSTNLDYDSFYTLSERIRLKVSRVFKNDISVAKRFNVYDYDSMFTDLKPIKEFGMKLFPSAVPGWDNTARRPNNPALLLHGSTPDGFEKWLKLISDDFSPYSENENFIFINAWNEWAEGNHLEPCLRWGTQYLEALQKVFSPDSIKSNTY